jgi:glutathionyl-hydroquinone reductase
MGKSGEYVRDTTYLDERITADGRDGWPVEPGRYRLVVARACPWAARTIIVRRLLGLDGDVNGTPVLSMGICGPEHDWRSWTFDLDPGEKDPVLGIHWLREAYEKAVPGYDRGVTVPAIVDIPTGKVVTSHFRHITYDMEYEWKAYHRPGAPDLYPEHLQDEIEAVSARIYEDVNNGVYKCGFAKTQQAYDDAYRRLFEDLDWLSERLKSRRYLVGDTITEADIRLWPTLARFDPVYHATSSATGRSCQRCRCCGPTRGTSSRRPASGTRSTSCRSSSTTTGSTLTSTRRRSSRPDRTCRGG